MEQQGIKGIITVFLFLISPWSVTAALSSPLSVVPAEEQGPGFTRGATASGSITVSPKFYALNPCETRQFTATVKGSDGMEIKNAKVTWKSSDPKVAKIDDNGLAVALSPGSASITPFYGKVKGTQESLFIRDKGVSKSCQ